MRAAISLALPVALALLGGGGIGLAQDAPATAPMAANLGNATANPDKYVGVVAFVIRQRSTSDTFFGLPPIGHSAPEPDVVEGALPAAPRTRRGR